ncbi:DNase I-like protein [Gloeophyllum trabeum ATCC 11539]|uniref:DNase I-like protein n=1 Tax=Gloeophyllum trabeum (strain ATCC 11539 / FP-39264 / Madison 617) TaxID=670483 RepID=S7Q4V5_GLOTA|nr:DNase I-like protein [Gloeophyllum trabeum ATCC 11539]EPQ54532.1 DNase I-like protein [Gloeophyllum trabeum ATCC 11539]
MRAFGFSFGLLQGATFVLGVSITDIQGPAFQSPLRNQVVHDVTGIVTAKGPTGFWISGPAVNDNRVSNGLSVYTKSTSILRQVNVGDEVSLSGRVSEYHSYFSPNDLFLTQLNVPSNIAVLSSNNTIKPVVLGIDKSPPTQQLAALDVYGDLDGFLSVPNNQSQLEVLNATLQPEKYGLDFWESLEGQLVLVKNPVALNYPTRFHEIWVHGDWPVTGKNQRGGLTITFGPDGYPDANPEAILIGKALDGTKGPDVAIGTTLSDIVGVVTYQYGSYRILPLTASTVVDTPLFDVPATGLVSNANVCSLVMADYNVENMGPRSHHLSTIAEHIVDKLRLPDLVFVQEIQDDSGPKNDGTVTANLTLTRLVEAIADASGGVDYGFVDVDPVNNQDGGQPGGNIRVAYLYRRDRVRLLPGSPPGGALDSTEPFLDSTDAVALTFNPGRIDPGNDIWYEARKPVAAAWQTSTGARFYTINVHFSSKRGSTSSQGNARTPINGRVDVRTGQANITATFVRDILSLDPSASILAAGDFNEYLQTRSVFADLSEVLHDIDETSNIDPVERYTYVYDQNTQQIDHIFVSNAIKERGTEVEHIHVNNWASSLKQRTSDHDPSVFRVRVCDNDARSVASSYFSQVLYALDTFSRLFERLLW